MSKFNSTNHSENVVQHSMLEVHWSSGKESFDVAAIKRAIEENICISIDTMEFRQDQTAVFYQPVLDLSNSDASTFTLVYKDSGKWIVDDEAGEMADGELGKAVYHFEKGSPQEWTCEWISEGNVQATAKPTCRWLEIETSRAYETVKRLVRDSVFRKKILGAHPSCVISKETNLRVLDAAHIVPVGQQGTDCAGNGIILRKDLHALFDAGILKLDDKGVFTMDPLLKSYKELFAKPHALGSVKLRAASKYIKERNNLGKQ